MSLFKIDEVLREFLVDNLLLSHVLKMLVMFTDEFIQENTEVEDFESIINECVSKYLEILKDK